MNTSLLALTVVLSAFVTALSVLVAFGLFDRRRTSQLRRFTEDERDRVVFIFENEALLDATPAARQLLDQTPRKGSAWAHLATLLAPRFPRLGELIGDLAEVGELELRSVDGAGRLRAEWHDGVARIRLDTADQSDLVGAGFDRHSLMAMTEEIKSLRASTEHTPYPQWREDRGGTISWCNAAYLALADTISGDDQLHPWPPARVFALGPDTEEGTAETGQGTRHRVAVKWGKDGTRHWFEITAVETADGGHFYSALPADRLVRAETALQEFVTTITKTFAALPIGLAIFDRSRELALFNPALMDLTMLPASFLIGKPRLSAFLDRLRQARMMPEPKDYRSWRQQMSDLETAAQNGTYEETWALPTGQTYRVTGRPHPDGAVALLFEDISAEISVTRRFRAELDTGQAALDALPQAIAVFSPTGTLTISNAAYARLWGDDPSTLVGDVTIRDALAVWTARAAPSPALDELRGHATGGIVRDTWRARIALTDGRTLLTRVTPLARGAMLVDFTLAVAAPAARPTSPAHLGYNTALKAPATAEG
ncbi:MAG: PAS-domain containing protein [Maritimibacter sp.]|nr:PAS-domain containing protein [Maritimibacter sp.]